MQESWFGFDHFYSDNSFKQALEIVFANPVRTLLDVGGNTGRWAMQCVAYSPEVEVTIMDLPQQLEMMREQTRELEGAARIHGHAADLLDDGTSFPQPFDAIWMSQVPRLFLGGAGTEHPDTCRPVDEAGSRLYIMETFWDRQRFETASYCLAQTSLYFTAMANGNSKMYYSADMAAW